MPEAFQMIDIARQAIGAAPSLAISQTFPMLAWGFPDDETRDLTGRMFGDLSKTPEKYSVIKSSSESCSIASTS